jgi:hypothetical protein
LRSVAIARVVARRLDRHIALRIETHRTIAQIGGTDAREPVVDNH